MDLKEFKCSVTSILTSSKCPVTVEKFRKDFLALEGFTVPYKRLGFNSDIELLQSITDILTLPPNPDSSSVLFHIVTEKSNHLKMLVEKQKPSRIRKSNSNRHYYLQNNNTNQFKISNLSQNTLNNNYRSHHQNRNNYGKSITHYSDDDYSQRNQPSTSNSGTNLNQNGNQSSGNLTDKLRAYLEFNLSQNQKLISKQKLEELIRSHEDFPALKTDNINNIFDKLENFLTINETGVSLKNKNQLNTKESTPIIYQEKDESSKLSKESDVNQSPHSHKNAITENGFNNYYKIINSSKRFDCDQYNDKNISQELKMNDQSSYVVFDNNIKTFFHKFNQIPEEVLYNIIKLFEMYNLGVNIENFKVIYKMEYFSTIDPSTYGFPSVEQMLKAFDEFITIRNEIMYTKPKYRFSCLYKNISYDPDKLAKQLMDDILMKNKDKKISLDIYEKSPYFEFSGKRKMVLAEGYNPSFFFMQLESNFEQLNKLTDNMKSFYSVKKNNYCVKPEQIIPGFIYATSYTSFNVKKQWHRIRVLSEVDSMTVEVIHVDYGSVDYIPKTEIRFLFRNFSKLSCQAIQCCLDGYHELESTTREVNKAFLDMIKNIPVYVSIDRYFYMRSRNKIFHVTLFKFENNSNTKGNLKDINFQLTTKHLKRYYLTTASLLKR